MIERDRKILRRLRDAGVTLTMNGGRLKYRAPVGAMPHELRDALRELKPTVLYEYHERAGILEYDARMPRAEAEAGAATMVLSGGEDIR